MSQTYDLHLGRRAYSLVSILLLPLFVVAQTKIQTIGTHNYGLYGDLWHAIVDGRRGDLIDTKHLVVYPKKDILISAFDFAKAGLPQMRIVRRGFGGGYSELGVPSDHDPFEVGRLLLATSAFEDVMFNIFYTVDATPNDTRYSTQWGLTKTQINSAWDITTGSSNVIVAIIDVGA